MFIVFEGGDGVGKSTQAQRLAQRLTDAGHATRLTREPGGTPLAEAIRAIILGADKSETMLPLTEALLMSAARAQHVAAIRQWLAAGEVVVSDRFTGATIAYQGYGRGYDVATLHNLNRLATGGLHPDLTFLLDLAPTERQVRAQSRGAGNRLDDEDEAFHARVQRGYLAQTGMPGWHVLDASASVDDLAEAIWRMVMRRLA